MTATELPERATDRPHHPVADLFPMLDADDIQALADDIAQRGLLQPIVLDSDGQVLDGRNRLEACALAGVKPTFTTYDGDDPAGYALAVNLNRRSMSKGQRAMVTAQAGEYLLFSQRELADATGVSQGYVNQATVVLAHRSDLAAAVVAGTASLNDAYVLAQQAKRDGERRETDLATLRAEAPQLLDEVNAERITLHEAMREHLSLVENARSAARHVNGYVKILREPHLRLTIEPSDVALAAIHGEPVVAFDPDEILADLAEAHPH